MLACQLNQGPRAAVLWVDKFDEVNVRIIEHMNDRAALAAGEAVLRQVTSQLDVVEIAEGLRCFAFRCDR